MDVDMEMDLDLGIETTPPNEMQLETGAAEVADTIEAGEILEDEPNDTTAEALEDGRRIVWYKVHIRGVEDLSTTDVRKFASENLAYAPRSIEWINDNSANIVYENADIAALALNNLSDPSEPTHEDTDPLLLRRAKQLPTHPYSDLSVRIAVATDIKKEPAREASRYYKTHPDEVPQLESRTQQFDESLYDDHYSPPRSPIPTAETYHPSTAQYRARDIDRYKPQTRRRPSRSRSRSPMRRTISSKSRQVRRDFSAERREKETRTANFGKELFPNKGKELFPSHRRQFAFDGADTIGPESPRSEGDAASPPPAHNSRRWNSSRKSVQINERELSPEMVEEEERPAGLRIKGMATSKREFTIRGGYMERLRDGKGTPAYERNAGKELFPADKGIRIKGTAGRRDRALD